MSASALGRQLAHPSAERRISAAVSLGRLGTRAADDLPILIRTLEDEDKRVREAVVEAIGHLQAAGLDCIGKLRAATYQATPGHGFPQTARVLEDLEGRTRYDDGGASP